MQWINDSLLWSYCISLPFVLLYFFSGITVPRRTSHVCLYNCWHLGKVCWLPSFCPQFSIHFLNSWHQRKGSILAGWRFASNGETVKNPWSSQISLLDSFCTFRKSNRNKVSFLDYSFTFVPVTQKVLFLCKSRINFLHFELLPPLSLQFPLFESRFSLN